MSPWKYTIQNYGNYKQQYGEATYITSAYVKNSLDYSTSDTNYVLSAYQGYVLDQNKQDKLTAGTNITIDANNVISASGGGGSYNDLTNKPSINSVTLSGDKTNADLGIPTITYGTTDITPGTSELADGTFYFVYE